MWDEKYKVPFDRKAMDARLKRVGSSITTAVETRIKSAVSCSFFNKRDRVAWSDWTWQNSAEKFDDAEIACLIYPRKLYLEVGNTDELFDCKYAIESFEKLKKLCKKVGTDWVDLTFFDGKHEFCNDDAHIERFIADLLSKSS